MENKIILQLIKNNLSELQMLVDALNQSDTTDALLIDIMIAKAKTLHQELLLLNPDQEHHTYPEAGKKQEEKKVSLTDVQDERIIKVLREADPIIEQVIQTITIENELVGVELKTEQVPVTPEAKVLGEKFSKETSLNERLAETTQKETRVKAKPVSSIKTAIGLNDRFLYNRELFLNDTALFETTVQELDQKKNFAEAIDYLEQHFKWAKTDTSLKFMDLVKRRFESLQ